MKPKTLTSRVLEDVRQQYLKNPAINNVDWFLNPETKEFHIETSIATYDAMDEGGFRVSKSTSFDPATGKAEKSMATNQEDLSILLQKYSPTGKYKVLLKANKGGMLIEIFDQNGIVSRQVVPPTCHMGLIRKSNAYVTEGIVWSEDENRFMYLADDPKKGLNLFKLKYFGLSRYKYEDLPGERLQTHTNPSIYIYDIAAKSLIRVQKPNTSQTSRIVYAQPQFTDPHGHSMVCLAIEMINSMEMAFFTNYPKTLKYFNQLTMSRVHRDFLKNKFIVPKEIPLGVDPKEQPIIYFPKVSADYKRVVYLFSDVLMNASANVFGMKMFSLEKPQDPPTTIIDVVKKETEGADFFGIMGMNYGLNSFGWLGLNRVVMTTYAKQTNELFEVDVDTKVLKRITKKLYLDCESQSIVGVLDDRHFIVKCDTCVSNGNLFIMRRTDTGYDQVLLHKPVEECSKYFEETIILDGIESTFYGKKEPGIALAERGVLIWVHGGPHNIFPNIMNPIIYYMMQVGFTVLNVNYLGSSGRGEAFMTGSHGADKNREADDVHNALHHLIEQKKCNPKNVIALSGSTGAMILIRYIIKYPEDIKSMSIFNPPLEGNQLNVESVFPGLGPSRYWGDNTPWDPSQDLTEENIQMFFQVNTLNFSTKFSTEVLLFGGLKDSIVTRGSNRHFYKQCRENGLKVELYEYPDDEHFILLPKNTYDYVCKSIVLLMGCWKFK